MSRDGGSIPPRALFRCPTHLSQRDNSQKFCGVCDFWWQNAATLCARIAAQRRKVDQALLAEHCGAFGEQPMYLCGPRGMGKEFKQDLLDLGADEGRIVHEDWSGSG